MSSASCTKGERRQHCNIAPYNNIRVFFSPTYLWQWIVVKFSVCVLLELYSKNNPPVIKITQTDAGWLLAWTETEQINKEFNIQLVVCSSLCKTTHKAGFSTVLKVFLLIIFSLWSHIHVKTLLGFSKAKWKYLLNSKAKFKNPVIQASCWPEGVGSWCSRTFQNSMFSTLQRLLIWYTATSQAHITLQIVAQNGKPDVYGGSFSSTAYLFKIWRVPNTFFRTFH